MRTRTFVLLYGRVYHVPVGEQQNVVVGVPLGRGGEPFLVDAKARSHALVAPQAAIGFDGAERDGRVVLSIITTERVIFLEVYNKTWL